MAKLIYGLAICSNLCSNRRGASDVCPDTGGENEGYRHRCSRHHDRHIYTMEIFTHSAQETEELGQKIAARILKKGSGAHSTILALYGELGSGKTTFVRGFGRGLGLPHRFLSPTFIIVREYPLETGFFRRFYHVDLFRTETEADLTDFGFTEIFADPGHLVVIEWAERLGLLLPNDRIDVNFMHKNNDKRVISIDDIRNKI